MRGRTPTIHCDGEDGMCGGWEIDDYALNTSAVNDVPITESHRALGWLSDDTGDYCPEHALTTTPSTEDRNRA